MEHRVRIGDRVITLNYEDILGDVDILKEITIDYGNIAGEAQVTPLMSNAVGMEKADLERDVSMKELEIISFEADFKKNIRIEAAQNNGYFFILDGKEKIKVRYSEKALEKIYCGDKKWQNLKNELFLLENYLSKMEVFYWKIKDKEDNLKRYVAEIAPEDMMGEIIEGKLNKVTITKDKPTSKSGGLS